MPRYVWRREDPGPGDRRAHRQSRSSTPRTCCDSDLWCGRNRLGPVSSGAALGDSTLIRAVCRRRVPANPFEPGPFKLRSIAHQAFMRAALFIAAVGFAFSVQGAAACEGCGCRGGPGYRGPDGQCVGTVGCKRPPEASIARSSASRSHTRSSEALSCIGCGIPPAATSAKNAP